MKPNKKLATSIIALFVALILVATTTYAWFTMNKEASAKGLSLTVTTADERLLVSTQFNGVYSNNINLKDYFYMAFESFDEDFGQYDFAEEFSYDGVSFNSTKKRFEDIKGKPIVQDERLTQTIKASSFSNTFTYNLDKSFISFYLYFQNIEESEIILDYKDTYIEPDIDWDIHEKSAYAWSDLSKGVYLPNTGEDDEGIKANAPLNEARAAYAIRVMLHDLTQDLLTEPINHSNPITWEPNRMSGYSAVRGAEGARNLAHDYYTVMNKYPMPTTVISPFKADIETNARENDEYSLQDRYAFSSVTIARLIKLNSDPYNTNTTPSENFYSKLKITIWLEGWDEDCVNTILTDRLLTKLSFKCR